MSENNESCGWVRLYHNSGAQVTIPLRGDITTFADQLDYLLHKAGFLVEAPGLEQGESKEAVGWIVRSAKQGRTGVADVLHLYADNEAWTKPFLTCYLNTDSDRAKFAAATGFPVSAIPEYIGEGRLERGKNPSADRLIYRVPKPFAVVFKPNPKYDAQAAAAAKANPNGSPYTVPKKVFVRWADQAPGEHHDEPAPQQPAQGSVNLPPMTYSVAGGLREQAPPAQPPAQSPATRTPFGAATLNEAEAKALAEQVARSGLSHKPFLAWWGYDGYTQIPRDRIREVTESAKNPTAKLRESAGKHS